MAALLFAVRAQVGAPAFMRGRSASALRKFGSNFFSRFSAGPSKRPWLKPRFFLDASSLD